MYPVNFCPLYNSWFDSHAYYAGVYLSRRDEKMICKCYMQYCSGVMLAVPATQAYQMELELYLILILLTSLVYRTSAQVCCPVSSANLVIQI